MFKKCKYVLPLMLGVALVNSGYSMLDSYNKRPFRGPVLSDKQIKSVLDSISVPESIKNNFSPLLQERRSFIIDQIDQRFDVLKNSIISRIDGILESHHIEPELSEEELYEGAKNEQSKFTEQEKDENIDLLDDMQKPVIKSPITIQITEDLFQKAMQELSGNKDKETLTKIRANGFGISHEGYVNPDDENLLIKSISFGLPNTLKILVEKGADVNKLYFDLEPVLMDLFKDQRDSRNTNYIF